MSDTKEEFLKLISLVMNDSKFNLSNLYPHSEKYNYNVPTKTNHLIQHSYKKR